jgi:hypothetical protein
VAKPSAWRGSRRWHTVGELIAKLDANSYKVREHALAQLASLGEIAAPAIEDALKNKPTLEMRMRLESLMRKLQSPKLSPLQTKVYRTLLILECAATPEARA